MLSQDEISVSTLKMIVNRSNSVPIPKPVVHRGKVKSLGEARWIQITDLFVERRRMPVISVVSTYPSFKVQKYLQ